MGYAVAVLAVVTIFPQTGGGGMLVALQRRLLLFLTVGLFLTLSVVAYTCRAALGMTD